MGIQKPPIHAKADSHVVKGWLNSVYQKDQENYDVVPSQTVSFSLADSFLYPVDTTGGIITATLPLATAFGKGKQYLVKRIAGGNVVTVAASATNTIDGAASINIAGIGDSMWFISDGSLTWYRIVTT